MLISAEIPMPLTVLSVHAGLPLKHGIKQLLACMFWLFHKVKGMSKNLCAAKEELARVASVMPYPGTAQVSWERASSQLHDGLETPKGVVPPPQRGWQRQGRVGKCVPPHGSSYAAAIQAKTSGHPLCNLHKALVAWGQHLK